MTRVTFLRPRVAGLAAAALVLAVAGCGGSQPRERAAVEIRGSDPSGAGRATAARAAPAVPSSGIVGYDGYQAARAQAGDTVATLAERVGLSASELGAYNGLSPTQPLRAGDELVLPPRPGGYQQVAALDPGFAAAAPAASAIEALPLDAGTAPASVAGGAGTAPAFAAAGSGAAIAAGAGAAAPVAAPVPSASGWSPELAASAIARSAGDAPATNTPGTPVAVPAPPSAGAPLPPEPQRARPLESPGLSQYQSTLLPEPPEGESLATVDTLAAAPDAGQATQPARRLQRPVEGPVALGFREGSGGVRNDGVDFAAPAGAPVVAAADGEVALVSEALGGLGTILLLRHDGELLTVYGRISGVTVKKGDRVRRGQQVGVVARPEGGSEPRMHFEVREGASSVNPLSYI